MIRRGRILLGIACGLIGGTVFFIQWLDVFRDRNAPITTGSVIHREPIQRLGFVRGVDFTIQLESGTQVHARAQRYLMQKVPDTVRFHFSGDTRREVFLFEHEESPLWIWTICWAGSAFLIWYWMRHRPAK